MLRFTACSLMAVALGLMLGAALASAIPAEEPTASMFQQPMASSIAAASTI